MCSGETETTKKQDLQPKDMGKVTRMVEKQLSTNFHFLNLDINPSRCTSPKSEQTDLSETLIENKEKESETFIENNEEESETFIENKEEEIADSPLNPEKIDSCSQTTESISSESDEDEDEDEDSEYEYQNISMDYDKPESRIFQLMVAIFFLGSVFLVSVILLSIVFSIQMPLGWDGKDSDKNNFGSEKKSPGIRVPTFFRKIRDPPPHPK